MTQKFTLTLLGCSLLAIGIASCGKQDNPSQQQFTTQPTHFSDGTKRPPLDQYTKRKDNIPQDHPYGVSSANPHATAAGMQILAQGGSAIDAAYAVQAVLGLVEPQSSGLMGGAFMMVYDPHQEHPIGDHNVQAWSGREISPRSATPDMFMTVDENGEPKKMGFYDAVLTGKSVGIPGVVHMLDRAHTQYNGNLTRAEIFAPAIKLADEGFEISPRLHHSVARFSRLKQMPQTKNYFYDADGLPLPVGHVLKNPEYANTLRAMQDDATDAFYHGKVRDDIIRTVNNHTGEETFEIEDFRTYTSVKSITQCAKYRDKRVCTIGPPSSGGTTVLAILQTLEQTDFDELPAQSPQAWHYLMEASRLAYADRNVYIADPSAMNIGHHDNDKVTKMLYAEHYIQDRAAKIQANQSMLNVEAGNIEAYLNKLEEEQGHYPVQFEVDQSPEPPATSHFTIVDREGVVVSMTTSVEFAFGSHLMAGGMILNNQLTDFSFAPTKDGKPILNAVAPHKHPRSSMTPVIILNEDGSVFAAFGSPGGSAIIGYVAKTIIGVVDWDMTLQDAINMPNMVIPRGRPVVERGTMEMAKIETLQNMGHDVQESDSLTSGVYGFVFKRDDENVSLQGGADPRREGTFETATPK